MDIPSTATVVALGDSGLALADPKQDIRGRRVLDLNGEDIGTVDDLLVDQGERKIRLLRVSSGGFLGIGADTFQIPLDAVHRVTADAVHVDRSRDRVAAAPAYDPNLLEIRYLEDLYGYYGYTPPWRSGHVYPTYPFYV